MELIFTDTDHINIQTIIEQTIITKENHIIWTGKCVSGTNYVAAIRINKISNHPYHWYYIYINKIKNYTKAYLYKYCEIDKCISHYMVLDTDESYYECAKHILSNKCSQSGTCLIWKGYCDIYGYGITSFRSKTMSVHILSMRIHLKGDIPEGQIVRHKCLNKRCCNIEHLELGTHKDNSNDRIRDGTDNRGEKAPNATITNEIAKEIYELRDKETKDLMNKFNVSCSIINNIINGVTWSHVTGHAKKQYVNKRNAISKDLLSKNSKKIKNNIENNVTHKFNTELNDNCWLWNLYVNINGHGTINFAGNKALTHRVSYMVYNNVVIPSKDQIYHKCKNKNCVNPDHLYIPNNEENSDQHIHSISSIKSKINTDTAQKILDSKNNGTIMERAKLYDVSISIVHAIDKRKTWVHLIPKFTNTTSENISSYNLPPEEDTFYYF